MTVSEEQLTVGTEKQQPRRTPVGPGCARTLVVHR